MPQAALAAVAVVGTVVSVIGAIKQGDAARSQANTQSQILQREAANRKAVAKIDAADFRRDASRRAAAIRAAEGASGLRIGTGSSLLAAEDFATQSAVRENRILLGGDLEAQRLQEEAHLTETAGRNTQQASRFRAGASLLRGAAGFGQAFGSSPSGGGSSRGLTSSQSGNLNQVRFQP